MKFKFFIFLLLIGLQSFVYSQKKEIKTLVHKNGITKPSVLSTHPFGIFISRIQGNFKNQSVKNTTIQLNLESGNVWAPPVKNYIPYNADDREFVSQFPWHNREFRLDVDTLDAQTIEIQIDGVLKGFNGQISFSIKNNHEINLGFRTYILTKGKLPFSIFTGDKFIELFHDNIAGGDDPFDRKSYALDEALIRYKDRNENILELNNGDFFLGGLDLSYYYYPEGLINKSKNLHFNFGAHLGTNLTKYNSSIDLGLSSNAIKSFSINEKKNINLGLSLGAIRKSVIEFKEENIDLGSNDFIGYLESVLEYNYISKKGTIHSFGTDFYFQTSLNKKKEFGYIIPTKNGISTKSWNIGWANLYTNNNYWTFMYSFTKKNTLTVYMQQDLTVNNNPDIQTGISYTFEL